jgi:hypothetical protein
MALDLRWKEPQGSGNPQLLRWAQDTTRELRKGTFQRLLHYVIAWLDPNATAEENKATLNAAAAELAPGKVLLIPEVGGACLIDTTGGLTDAVEITHDDVTVIIHGHLKANYSAVETNPAYIFDLVGDRIKFLGSGKIEGDGQFHVSATTTANMPGLVYVRGDKFSCEGLTVRRTPETGFMLIGDFASFSNVLFEGGPITWEASTIPPDYDTVNPDYDGSAHFFIVATGSIGHSAINCRFLPDEDGGSVVNAIFTAGVSGVAAFNRVEGCICENAWEKLFYGYGDRNICSANNIKAVYPYGYTDAIRMWGYFSISAHNTIDGYRSGIQMLDSFGSKILFNELLDIRNSGINVEHFTNTAGGFTDQVNYAQVFGNLVRRDSSQAGDPRFGIRYLGHSDAHMFGPDVSFNTLEGWGTEESDYAMQITAGSGRQIQNGRCQSNLFVDCASGLIATRFAKGSIFDNKFKGMSHVHIHLVGGDDIFVHRNTGTGSGSADEWSLSQATGGDSPTNVRYVDNSSTGVANIGIRNHAFGSSTENSARGNQWTAKALIKSATLSAAATTTVTHGGVAAHASITVMPQDNAGAALRVYGVQNAPDLDIKTGTGGAAAGTEVVRYEIIQ